MPKANELLLGVGIALNKTEFDNAFDHFPGAREGELDAISFSEALTAPASTGAEPRFFDSKGVAIPQGQARMTFSGPGYTPHSKHLGLSGISHVDFGTQHKPFPAHWGVPPNVPMHPATLRPATLLCCWTQFLCCRLQNMVFFGTNTTDSPRMALQGTMIPWVSILVPT